MGLDDEINSQHAEDNWKEFLNHEGKNLILNSDAKAIFLYGYTRGYEQGETDDGYRRTH